MVKKILITGICGFIAHHLLEHILRRTNWTIIGIDKLSYASKGLSRLRDNGTLSNDRVKIFTWDLSSPLSDGLCLEIGSVNYIIHMAADTHVDDSITRPVSFINNNISSTLNMLEFSRGLLKTFPGDLEKFFYFSTDEVYGKCDLPNGYKEDDRHNPSNPYSASKSSSEAICLSYANTYGLPIIITNLMNVFGERQHVEKFIPKCIKSLLEGETVQIHSDSECVLPGSRFYIHARNVSSAVCFLIDKGVIGERYNITGEKEVDNLTMLLTIARIMEKEPKYVMVNFHKDRPGHDLRYGLCGDKLRKLGWTPPVGFEDSLRKTIGWTLQNLKWLDP